MDFINLTRKQNYFLYKIVNSSIIYVQTKILNEGLDFDLLQILKAFVKYFMSCSEIRKEGVLRTVLQLCCFFDNVEYFIDDTVNTAKGYNLAGRIMRLRDKEQDAQYYLHRMKLLIQNCGKQDNKMTSLSDKLFQCEFQDDLILNAKNKYLPKYQLTKKTITYAMRFQSYQKHKQRLMEPNCMFNKENISYLYQHLVNKNKLDNRQKAIVKSDGEYINGNWNLIFKHASYQFMQYLLTVTAGWFRQEFHVNDNEGITMLVRFIQEYRVQNLTELKVKARIVKHMECSWINIEFSNKFKIEDIPDDVLMRILDNIENRLQFIDGQYDHNFIIIRRIPDNKILKSIISDQKQIEDILKQQNNEEIYDVVIYSYLKQESLDIKIRYLNYVKLSDKIEITLKYPECLVSASLSSVKITNISQCTNLRNLYSQENTYAVEDIQSLTNLRRVYIINDKYQDGDTCLLRALFQNNKLEYVYADDGYSDSNLLKSLILTQNTENLRFLNIAQWDQSHSVTLDVASQIPKNLVVYNVGAYGASGTLTGDTEMVKTVEKQLIHDLKAAK